MLGILDDEDVPVVKGTADTTDITDGATDATDEVVDVSDNTPTASEENVVDESVTDDNTENN